MPKNHLKYLCHKLIRSQSIRRVGSTLSYSVSCMLYEIIYSIWSLHSAMIPSISRICDCCLSHCVCVCVCYTYVWLDFDKWNWLYTTLPSANCLSKRFIWLFLANRIIFPFERHQIWQQINHDTSKSELLLPLWTRTHLFRNSIKNRSIHFVQWVEFVFNRVEIASGNNEYINKIWRSWLMLLLYLEELKRSNEVDFLRCLASRFRFKHSTKAWFTWICSPFFEKIYFLLSHTHFDRV